MSTSTFEVSSGDSVPRPDRRERSDSYAGEILRAGDWRVALCRDHLQWLLQRRRNPRQEGATAAWDSVGFCRSRAALLRLWRAQTGEDGAALERLLPEHIGQRAARGR